MRRTIIVALAVVMVGATAAVAAAQESGSGEGRGRGRGRGHRFDLRLLHADGVAMKRDGTFVDVRVQKGVIEAIEDGSVTLKSADGFVGTYATDADTRVFEKRRPSSIADLDVGDMAKVLAVKEGDGYMAKLINCIGKPGRKPREPAARSAA